MTQNRYDISGSGPSPAAGQPGPVSGAASSATVSGNLAGHVDLTLDRMNKGAYTYGVLLYNAYCTAQTIELTAQLLDRNGSPRAVTLETFPAADREIPPGEYKAVGFSLRPEIKPSETTSAEAGVFAAIKAALLSSPIDYGSWKDILPARVTLFVKRTPAANNVQCAEAGGVLSSTKWNLLLKPPLPAAVDKGVLLAALVLSGIVTLLAGIIISSLLGKKLLLARMGEVTFDFNNSWGANVAIGAGILNALTSGTLLLLDQLSSSRTYLLLAVLFGAFVLLGATLYGLIRPPVRLEAGTKQGYVSMYLLSSGVVLWGAFGQLLLLGMIFRELILVRVLAPEPAYALILMTKGLIGLLITYAVITALRTVKESTQKSSRATAPEDMLYPHASMI